MRRDIANEVVVAIVAVAVIAFALSFGILLTLSSNSGGARVTQTATEAAVSVGRTLTIVRIDSPVSVSATADTSHTATGSPTEELTIFTLLAPTHTLTPTFTPTRVAATIEPTTAVAASVATTSVATTSVATTSVTEASVTKAATAVETEANTVASTDEATQSPSDVPSVTATTVSTVAASPTVTPTHTATFTSTPKPTLAPTAAPTATATKPTLTNTPTFTHTATHTVTKTATATATATVPVTVAISPTNIPATSVPTGVLSVATQVGNGGCQPRTDWPRYLLTTGDTLASIAQQVQSTEAELGSANCLESSRVLIVGDVLFVPRLPILPTPASGFPLPALRKLGCADEDYADISNLYPGQRLSGQFVIQGTARLDSTKFTQYILEIRPDAELTFTGFSQSNKAVSNGELARHDTAPYNAGIYWLRLIVRDASGMAAPDGVCVLPVAFD